MVELRPIAVDFKGAAKLVSIPATTLRDDVRNGKLAACIRGDGKKKRYVILIEDLEEYVRSMRVPAKCENGE